MARGQPRHSKNTLRGSLIEGDFLLARTYWGISEESERVKGLVISSTICSQPMPLNSFAQSINLGYSGSILYSKSSIEQIGRAMLDPHLWGYMRILVHKSNPLLTLMGCDDGTLPALWIDGHITPLPLL